MGRYGGFLKITELIGLSRLLSLQLYTIPMELLLKYYVELEKQLILLITWRSIGIVKISTVETLCPQLSDIWP